MMVLMIMMMMKKNEEENTGSGLFCLFVFVAVVPVSGDQTSDLIACVIKRLQSQPPLPPICSFRVPH